MNEFLDYIESGKRVELITHAHNSTTRFYCAYYGIENNSIVLSCPKNKHIKFNLPTGENIYLYAYTRGGVFKLTCKLLSYNEKQCILSLPLNVEKIQRREYIRVKMQIDTVIKIIDYTGTKIIRTKSKDISAKGIRLLLDHDISKSVKIEISIIFPEQTINTLAKVIKIKQTDTETFKQFNTSLTFISITDKEMNFIVKKCFEYEAAQRKKMLEKEI